MKFLTIASLIMAVVPAIAQHLDISIYCPRTLWDGKGDEVAFYRRTLIDRCRDGGSCQGASVADPKLWPAGRVIGSCLRCPDDLDAKGQSFGPCPTY